jgi:hypothetical protein
MCDDNDISIQEYTDIDIITNLRIAVILMEGVWDHGNTVRLNPGDVNVNAYYEIVGDNEIPQWLEILYVLKAVIGTHAYRDRYSYSNGVMKVTNADQSQNKKTLKEFYDETMEARKYNTVGFSYSTFDDFFTRPELILDEISKGYR